MISYLGCGLKSRENLLVGNSLLESPRLGLWDSSDSDISNQAYLADQRVTVLPMWGEMSGRNSSRKLSIFPSTIFLAHSLDSLKWNSHKEVGVFHSFLRFFQLLSIFHLSLSLCRGLCYIPLCIVPLLTSLVAQTVKASAYNARDPGLIPGWGRSPGEGNGNPLQFSCLENPMDREAWQATVHEVTKSQIQLSE